MYMKRTLILLIPMLALAACSQPAQQTSAGGNTSSANTSPAPVVEKEGGGEELKEPLNQLLELAKQGNCKAMDGKLARHEKSGPWKHSLSYSDEQERLEIEKMCAKLQVMVAGLDHVEFAEFIRETESEGEWNVWEVVLHYQDGSSEKNAFAFLPSDQGYLLGDID